MSNTSTKVGWFLAGTKVLLADGRAVDIEKLKEGQRVLTKEDGIGIVSSEHVVSEHDAGDLYGINDDAPFFTGDNVFYTPHGLCAIQVREARKANPWLEVGPLRPGDYVYQVENSAIDAGKLTVTHKLIQITKFTKVVTPRVRIFGLHFHEGLRSFHANKYLVYLNYPEITTSSFTRGLNSIPKAKQAKIRTQLHDILPEIRAALNPLVADALEASLQQRPSAEEPVPSPSRSFIGLHRYLKFFFASKHPDVLPKELVVHKRSMYLDGAVVKRVHFHENQVTWTRPLTGDNYEHGYAQFERPAMLTGTGRIVVTKNKHEIAPTSDKHSLNIVSFNLVTIDPSASMAHFARVAPLSVLPAAIPDISPAAVPAAVPAAFSQPLTPATVSDSDTAVKSLADTVTSSHIMEYTTLISNAPVDSDATPPPDPDGTAPDITNYAPFWNYVTGSLVMSDDSIETIRYFRVPNQGLRHFGKRMFYIAPDSTQLAVQIAPNLQYLAGYCALELHFSSDYSSFIGYAWKFDSTQKGFKGQAYVLYGHNPNYSVPISDLPPDAVTSTDSSSPSPTPVPSPSLSPSPSPSPSPAPVATFLAATSSSTLNITDLMQKLNNFPTADGISEEAYASLYKLMIYCMSDFWRGRIFGQATPQLDSFEQAIADDTEVGTEFLYFQYACAYGARALQNSADFAKLLTADEWKRINYWLQGTDTPKVLAKNAVFNRLNSQLTMHAYAKRVPGLSSYQSDTSNDWGKAVYTKVTASVNVAHLSALMANPATAGQGIKKISNTVMLLKILSPTAKYASDFYTLITSRLTADMGQYLSENIDTKTFQNYLYQALTLLLSSSSLLDPKMVAQFQTYLADARTELNLQATAAVQEYITKSSELTTQFLALFNFAADISSSNIGSWAGRFANACKGLADKFPTRMTATAKLIGNLGGIATYGFGIYQAVVYLRNWDTLTGPQITQLTINSIVMAGNILNSIPDLYESFKGTIAAFKNPSSVTPEVMTDLVATQEALPMEEIAVVSEAGDISIALAQGTGIATDGPIIDAPDLRSFTSSSEAVEVLSDEAVIAELGSESLPTDSSLFERFSASKVPTLVLKGATVVALAFSCWSIGEQLAADIASGATVEKTTLDAALLVTTGLQGVLEVVEIGTMIMDTVCPAIPIVGALLALAGGIIQLIMPLFDFNPVPDDPLGDFVSNVKSFVATYTDPVPVSFSENYGDFKPKAVLYTISNSLSGNVKNLQIDGYDYSIASTHRFNQMFALSSKYSNTEFNPGHEISYTITPQAQLDGDDPGILYFIRAAANSVDKYVLLNASSASALAPTLSAVTRNALGAVSFQPLDDNNEGQRWMFNEVQDAFVPTSDSALYTIQSGYNKRVIAAYDHGFALEELTSPPSAAQKWKFVHQNFSNASTYLIVSSQTGKALYFGDSGGGNVLMMDFPDLISNIVSTPNYPSPGLWLFTKALSGGAYIVSATYSSSMAIGVRYSYASADYYPYFSRLDKTANFQEWTVKKV